jgi:hypothetical protein
MTVVAAVVAAVVLVVWMFRRHEPVEIARQAPVLQVNRARHLPEPVIKKHATIRPPDTNPAQANASPSSSGLREQELKVERARAQMQELIVRYKIVDFLPPHPNDSLGRLKSDLDRLLNAQGEELVRTARFLGLLPEDANRPPADQQREAEAIRTRMTEELTRRGGQIETMEVEAVDVAPAPLPNELARLIEYHEARQAYHLELETLQKLVEQSGQ